MVRINKSPLGAEAHLVDDVNVLSPARFELADGIIEIGALKS
jgi:hypothetical protein